MPVLRRAVAPIIVVVALALGSTAGAYVVRPGDTLTAIAGRLGVSVHALAQANGITNPNHVVVGRSLRVPGGPAAANPAPAPATTLRSHVVAAGETLSAVATHYGTTVPALVWLNALRDPNHVGVGTRLRIPASAPATGLPSRLLSSPERIALMPHFDRWADANSLPRDLVKAVAWQESGWQTSVISPAGAIGIGQLLPSTAAFVSRDLIGVSLDPKVPAHNIRIMSRYLRWLLDRSNGDVDAALSGYYQGPASVASIGRLPTTVDYIAIVRALRPRFVGA
ncbi:MAG: hypothetical protein QOI47_2270 [Actinomycetota bacterium]|nr:hypothetical protein [Actinomycetota bacterium]